MFAPDATSGLRRSPARESRDLGGSVHLRVPPLPRRATWGAIMCAVVFMPRAAAEWSSVQADTWREQIKAAWFVPNPLPELAPETHGRFTPTDGVVAERVTYGTQFGLRVP
jgi:hypothetical protein